MAFFEQFFCPFNYDYSLILDDDDSTGYCYLLFKDDIIGDVWLYNRIVSQNYFINNRDGLPPTNPSHYLIDESCIIRIATLDNILVRWTPQEENEVLDSVLIFYDHKLIAKINVGQKIGWSINARVDGPLAKSF